jgi:hypothetical protein
MSSSRGPNPHLLPRGRLSSSASREDCLYNDRFVDVGSFQDLGIDASTFRWTVTVSF